MKHATIELLLLNLKSNDIPSAIDAAHTLGRKKYSDQKQRVTIVKQLLQRLKNAHGDIREHIIIALKEIPDELSLNNLIEIINDSDESPRARAYALNALGKIGSRLALTSVIDYLKNHNNPYRDSASWSLQYIAKSIKEKYPDLLKEVKSTYYECLVSETNDVEGKYAKGNIVYSLSELKAYEYAERVLEWLQLENEPYVIEDGINAVGILGGKSAVDILVPFLKNEDPVIRMKTAEALSRLKAKEAIEYIKKLKTDYFILVQEAAEEAIGRLSSWET